VADLSRRAQMVLVSRESLPRDADDAGLLRVEAEEVRRQLLGIVAEQRRLRSKQRPCDASDRRRGLTDVILSPDAADPGEMPPRGRHLEISPAQAA
jgi:hypothetical protein